MDALRDSTAVEFKRVSRTYQSGASEVKALDDISFRIDRGAAIAVTGPSGSGKTTLLNLTAGLDRATRGHVEVLGRGLDGMHERELANLRASSLGIVFQDPHLLPGLTALENVVAARLPLAPRRQLEPRARELLAEVGLKDRLYHPPARLSGGERQRVGIARALLGNPALVLADEPTGNLDLETSNGILVLLDKLWRDRQFTLIVATHNPAVAAVAHAVINLVGGRIGEHRHVDRQVEEESGD